MGVFFEIQHSALLFDKRGKKLESGELEDSVEKGYACGEIPRLLFLFTRYAVPGSSKSRLRQRFLCP
jgi:hypothetical protein